MAEMVSSAVVHETVSQILSGMVHRYEGKEKSNENKDLERLDMAHIRLEAALEISEKWQITDASLLRWRKKLKRAAQECDDTLHKCKHRILEQEQIEEDVRISSLPRRIAYAAKSLILSAFNRHDHELSRYIVQRFEWFADSASEFLRFIEFGGTPRHHMPFNPLVKHLLTGMKLQHKINQGNECPLFLLWEPFSSAEHGIEGRLFFIQKDSNAEDNFFLCIMLQLSESTDIVGIAIECLQLFTPLFKSKVDIIRNKLMQLPTQDFSWMPFIHTRQEEHWNNIHSFSTRWFRPNPSCCKQPDKHGLCCSSNRNMSEFPHVSLEPVIEVHLQCQVSLHRDEISQQGSPRLIAGLLFMPHGSSENLLPADKSCATAVIDSGEQHCLHTDITLAQLEEITLPKAVDHFRQNSEAATYQMLWRSEHSTAYIQVEKGSRKMQSKRRMIRVRGARTAGKILQRQELANRPYVIPHFLKLWVPHAPVQLQGSILKWIREEEENKLAPVPLRLKL